MDESKKKKIAREGLIFISYFIFALIVSSNTAHRYRRRGIDYEDLFWHMVLWLLFYSAVRFAYWAVSILGIDKFVVKIALKIRNKLQNNITRKDCLMFGVILLALILLFTIVINISGKTPTIDSKHRSIKTDNEEAKKTSLDKMRKFGENAKYLEILSVDLGAGTWGSLVIRNNSDKVIENVAILVKSITLNGYLLDSERLNPNLRQLTYRCLTYRPSYRFLSGSANPFECLLS